MDGNMVISDNMTEKDLKLVLKVAEEKIFQQQAEIERLRQKIKDIDEHFCNGEIEKGMAIVINLVNEMTKSSTKIEHSSLCETESYEVKE